MALEWDFKEKAGMVTEVQDGHEFTLPFYTGNALMIVTYEYEDNGKDMYDLMWFFTGKEHAQNCLGLRRNSRGEKDNMFGENGITKLVIYREWCREWKTLVDLFTAAFPHIVIEIREKEPSEKQSAPPEDASRVEAYQERSDDK